MAHLLNQKRFFFFFKKKRKKEADFIVLSFFQGYLFYIIFSELDFKVHVRTPAYLALIKHKQVHLLKKK